MIENLKQFKSISDYKNWKATDGWPSPSVCYISSPFEDLIMYDREIKLRWYDSDTTKIPYISGSITLDEFKYWVDNASSPCEIKKDGTNFNYLLRSDFSKTATGYNGLTEKGLSHYNTPDKADYLQLAEIKQVNVGLFQDSQEGWKEVRFNFDLGCPKGYHKWFSHPYWNDEINTFTKLIGRYDATPLTSTTNTQNEGINCCYGENQGTADWPNQTYSKGNWNLDYATKGFNFLNKTLNGDEKILSITYWEYLVLSYIYCLYYKTFNTQSVAFGLAYSFNQGYAGDWTNGQTDILGEKPHGKIVQENSNEPYRFMFLENPLHGKQWIMASGFGSDGTSSTINNYWITFDDLTAHIYQPKDLKQYSDIFGTYPFITNSSWITDIDLYGLIQNNGGGSSSEGFYDQVYTYGSKYKDHIALLGGHSNINAGCGVFSRSLDSGFGSSIWTLRARLSMNR